MRALTPVALSLSIMACAARGRASVIVEDETPIVGANGATMEALGIETLGGVFTPLIPAGTSVPCSVNEVFSTAADGQTQITIALFRGTDRMAARNRALGRFQVVDIRSGPRGVPRVQVTFAIAKRTISLSARDLARKTDLQLVRLGGDGDH